MSSSESRRKPCQDRFYTNRAGRREWAAYLGVADDPEFEVAYLTFSRCGLGWVGELHTVDSYRAARLAAAALAAPCAAAIRALSWHTLDGHTPGSRWSWAVVGAGVYPATTGRTTAAPQVSAYQ